MSQPGSNWVVEHIGSDKQATRPVHQTVPWSTMIQAPCAG